MAGIGHRHRLLVLVASPGASLQRRVGALKMRQDATRVNQKGRGGSGEHRLATQQLQASLRIESAFNRLKDFRRIATRYDRVAQNDLASVCLVAALVWWI